MSKTVNDSRILKILSKTLKIPIKINNGNRMECSLINLTSWYYSFPSHLITHHIPLPSPNNMKGGECPGINKPRSTFSFNINMK